MPRDAAAPFADPAVVLAGTFMAVLDVAIVNVAIPSIRGGLHASFGGVELVISAYTLTYACLLITGGRLGDIRGRRVVFVAGLLLFSAASAPCGAAPTIGVLIAARAVQGVGGALLVAAALAFRLPLTPFEAENALIERLPGWAAGFSWSMFLATGGRVGDRLFADVLSRMATRRLRRTETAPEDPGDFLAFLSPKPAGAWLSYLIREGLASGAGPVAHEAERLPVIRAQVEEIRRRQEEGLIDPDLDAELVRLLGFALASHPRALPQVTRMTTGLSPADPEFAAAWERFLREVGERLRPASSAFRP